MALLVDPEFVSVARSIHRYDACLCELRPDELASLRELHARIRPMIREGGEIAVYVFNKNNSALRADDLAFCDSALPDLDRSAIYFFGSRTAAVMRRLYLKASTSLQGNPMARGVLTASVLLALAPFAWLINTAADRRDASIFKGTWTSLMMVFTMGERQLDSPQAQSAQRRRNPAHADE